MLSGSGDSIVDLVDWPSDRPAIVHIVGPTVYDNFVIWNYDAAGERIDLLVNTIGNYEGYIPLNFFEGEESVRLEIGAGGPWTIELLPLTREHVHMLEVPGTYQGQGDDVIFLIGRDPDLASFTSGNRQDNFVVWSYGQTSGRDLLVNDIAPYEGTVIIPRDVAVLIVSAGQSGPWSVEVTAR